MYRAKRRRMRIHGRANRKRLRDHDDASPSGRLDHRDFRAHGSLGRAPWRRRRHRSSTVSLHLLAPNPSGEAAGLGGTEASCEEKGIGWRVVSSIQSIAQKHARCHGNRVVDFCGIRGRLGSSTHARRRAVAMVSLHAIRRNGPIFSNAVFVGWGVLYAGSECALWSRFSARFVARKEARCPSSSL